MNKKCLSLLLLGLISVGSFEATTKAMAASDAEFTQQLQRILKERPDLIMNILRANSEAILDIAQEGSVIKRRRNMEAQWRNDLKEEKNINIADRPVWGDANAPVTIVEFSDFTCPYCAQATATLARLKKAYGDKVNIVFKHTPISSNPKAILASEYVIAAGLQAPALAQKFYENIFAKRDELMEKGETFLKAEAKALGLNLRKLSKDARSKKVKGILSDDLKHAKELGVEGTPFFFVNNIVVRGAVSEDLFKAAIDMALEHEEKN